MSNRRKNRETVMQALYAHRIGGHNADTVIHSVVKPELHQDPAGLSFAEKLFLRTLDHLEQTDDIIRAHIANWEINRLATLDRIILEMAISELITFDDIPAKVTINEAIEIAKKYSTAKSGRFVNGILDAVLETLSRDNLIKKTGRGLLDQPPRQTRIPEPEELPSDPVYPAEDSEKQFADQKFNESQNRQTTRPRSRRPRITRKKSNLT